MTNELELSIERLYSTFSPYPYRSEMDGCPCCVSQGDKEKLHTKKLRALEGEDLSRYAFKAMTTWGMLKTLNTIYHESSNYYPLLILL